MIIIVHGKNFKRCLSNSRSTHIKCSYPNFCYLYWLTCGYRSPFSFWEILYSSCSKICGSQSIFARLISWIFMKIYSNRIPIIWRDNDIVNLLMSFPEIQKCLTSNRPFVTIDYMF